MMETNSYIKGLDSLRAICALFVLWGHVSQRDFCQWEITHLPLPECSAYVFFVISGFLAGYRMSHIKGILPFYKKKAQRLLPLYYSYLLFSVAVYVAIGWSEQILDARLFYYIFLLPQIPFCRYCGIIPLVHLWFIGTIAFFYFVLPFFAKLKEDKQISGAIMIACSWLLIKLACKAFLGSDSVSYRLISVTCFDVLFSGVWIGLLLKKGSPWLSKVKDAVWLGIIAWILFLCSGFYGRLVPAVVRIEFISLLAIIIILTQQAESPLPILRIKSLEWLGSISYEIYVIQVLVIIMVYLVFSKWGVELPSIAIYLICTVLVIGSSWCFRWGSSMIVEKFK